MAPVANRRGQRPIFSHRDLGLYLSSRRFHRPGAKNIAIDKPVNILLAIVHPIMFFHVVFFPLVWIFDRSAAAITRLLGFSIHPDEDIYTQNEIVSSSQESEKAGELDRADVLFMERAFKMNDKVAGDIMVDRTQLTVIDVTETIDDAAHLYFEKKYTRFPVVANHDKDHILGYIFSYDIMRQNQINPEESIRAIVRRLPIAYENQPITDVLQIMIKSRFQWSLCKMSTGNLWDRDRQGHLRRTLRDDRRRNRSRPSRHDRKDPA